MESQLSENELATKKLSALTNNERRRYRIDVYHDTLKAVRNGYYFLHTGERVELLDNGSVERNLKINEMLAEVPRNVFDTEVLVVNGDSLDVGIFLKNLGYSVLVLNMANNVTPGGGITSGAGAQEESIFRRSNYVNHLNEKFYPINTGIYSPGVLIFRASEAHEYMYMQQPEAISLVAVAGPRRPELMHVEGKLVYKNNEDRNAMKMKIRSIFTAAGLHSHDCVVAGALGCGAYQNPPEVVAQIFKEVLEEPEYKGRFRKVVFAIFNDHNAFWNESSRGNVVPFAETFNTEVVYNLHEQVKS